MDIASLVSALRSRANDPQRRTDGVATRPVELGLPAALDVLERAERALRFPLYPLHKQLLIEVGNGGFGPATAWWESKGVSLTPTADICSSSALD